MLQLLDRERPVFTDVGVGQAHAHHAAQPAADCGYHRHPAMPNANVLLPTAPPLGVRARLLVAAAPE